MKLSSRQIDALASDIRNKIINNPEYNWTDEVSEKKVKKVYDKFLKSSVYKNIMELYKALPLSYVSMGKKDFYDVLWLDTTNISNYNITLEPKYIENQVKGFVRETLRKQYPTLSQIANKLVLETILINKDESIDTFMDRFIKKLMD